MERDRDSERVCEERERERDRERLRERERDVMPLISVQTLFIFAKIEMTNEWKVSSF